MKRLPTVMFLSSALFFTIEVAAQAEPFRNLDFESAMLPEPSPEGYWGSLSHFLALPYWDLQINRAPYDWVLHNDSALDWAYAAVYDWRARRYRSGVRHVMQGQVEVLLRAGDWDVGPLPGMMDEVPVAISQVGTVPADAKSIHLLVRTYVDPFTLSLGGEEIPMLAVAQFPDNVTEYAGSVTRFAGTTTALTITAVPRVLGNHDAVAIDAISFSPVPVPEPSSLALAVMAFGGFAWCVARRKFFRGLRDRGR